jgi:Fur family transcriptional regulator, peroxide stress response regulator
LRQRIAVLDAIINLKSHPSAEVITDYIKERHPNISRGTVYNTLEILVKNNLISKVKTENGIMRYDAVITKHHHLYCSQTDRIEDFYDDELNDILAKYLLAKKIPDFQIEDFKLHIVGKFTDGKSAK